MSDPSDHTREPTRSGLREGHTGGIGNFSGMRSDDSACAELAGGLSEPLPPTTPAGPDPFDLEDAYPYGAELAGPVGD